MQLVIHRPALRLKYRLGKAKMRRKSEWRTTGRAFDLEPKDAFLKSSIGARKILQMPDVESDSAWQSVTALCGRIAEKSLREIERTVGQNSLLRFLATKPHLKFP